MEKVTADDIDAEVNDGSMHYSSEFYYAADVDALLADVRRLVEALNKWVNPKYCYDLQKAIAAVERHLGGLR